MSIELGAMLRRRSSILSLVLACGFASLLLTACGSTPRPLNVAASVGKDRITEDDVSQMMEYVQRFFAWTYPGSGGVRDCTRHRTAPACKLLRHQIVSRLLQDHIVAHYASDHHIRLTRKQYEHIDRVVATLSRAGAETALLFKEQHVSRAMMRRVLVDQLLVRAVEHDLFSARAGRGPAVHLRTFSLPRDAAHRQQAIDLATDGRPIPPGAVIHTRWIAPWRVPSQYRKDVLIASPGDFLGPYVHGSHYVVVQLLGKGVHQLGRPARTLLETRYFSAWLRRALAKANPVCYTSVGAPTSCAA